jgi:integrase
VSLRDHILPALKRKDATAKHHRIAVLKGLYSWLRTEAHRISTAEDPVFGQLKVPQAKVAQLSKSKIIPRENVLLVIERLRAEEVRRRELRAERLKGRGGKPSGKEPREVVWADALTLQAGTGWHTTEVQRFADAGSIEPLPKHAQDGGVGGVVVCPMRKSGEPQRTRVSLVVLEAAKRLRAHGRFSIEWYDRSVKEACAAVKRPDGGVGVPEFTPGQLRHTTASFAMDVGADPAMVSAFLGHRSPRTTKKFYATHATVAKVPTLL